MNLATATQIAYLLNKYNNLRNYYDGPRILNSRAHYFPLEIAGFVLGVIASYRINLMLSEIKHLVTHPSVRRCGVAKFLLGKAIEVIDTPVILATIRSDNPNSIKLFKSFGFKPHIKASFSDHDTTLFIRAKQK